MITDLLFAGANWIDLLAGLGATIAVLLAAPDSPKPEQTRLPRANRPK